jgi:hypothetical protein
MKMMKHMTSSNLEYGKIYTAFVKFKISDKEGKYRPVILFQNQENENLTVFQVSSQTDSPFNLKNGYQIKDWQQAGFKKPSVANLHPKDLIELKPQQLKSVVGELTDFDKIGLLEKFISIQKRLQKQYELER